MAGRETEGTQEERQDSGHEEVINEVLNEVVKDASSQALSKKVSYNDPSMEVNSSIDDMLYKKPDADNMSIFDKIVYTKEEEWQKDYWCKVAPFREFVTSKEHLNLAPLSDRQFKCIFDFIGEDQYKIFDGSRIKKMAVWLLGKGSGKDYQTSILLAYLFYILLCMKDPHKYFGLPKEDNIDLINVATNARQARRVFFNKFSKRIMNWRWLLQNYKITRRGRVIKGSVGNIMEIKIADTTIETDHNIRCNSEHSDAGGYEGYNVLVFVLDEASEFDDKFESMNEGDTIVNVGKAQLIYDTLRTSAASRNWPWLGIAISFPRRQEDFMIRLHDFAVQNSEGFMVADRGCTWEFNPRYKGEKSFKFEKWDVPLSLKSEFETDPVGSKMRYCTEPPVVQNAFFYNTKRIHDAIDDSIKPLVELTEEIQDLQDASGKLISFVIRRITSSRLIERGKAYAAHIDLSINGDTTSLAIGHGEPCDIKSTFVDLDGSQKLQTLTQRVVIDQIVTWEPKRIAGKQSLVSHINVDEVMEQLSNICGLSYLSYDQYQSQYVLEKAMRNGIVSEKHDVKNADYILLRNMIYSGAVSLPNHKKLIMELERVIWDGTRIDHPYDFSKDCADCVAGVVAAITSKKAKPRDAMSFSFFSDDVFGTPMANQVKTIQVFDPQSGTNLNTGFIQDLGQEYGFL